MFKRPIVFLSLLLLSLMYSVQTSAQITGMVTDSNNLPLSYVNIYIDNAFIGTTSNEDGQFELLLENPGNYTVVFKYLGYKTVIKDVAVSSFPYPLNIVLNKEDISLNEVVISSKENPANHILRQAIAKRQENLEKINAFKAQFYSRGFAKIKDVPERFLGQEIGDFDGNLDSTRSGIIYLSETLSDIYYQFPDKLKERIKASKVSGNDNGFSFNTASDADFNFYNNTIDLGNALVSPIANNAFGFYDYKLEGSFYDEQGQLINQIKVSPKRKNDNAFSGQVFIVEDDWTLYGLKLSVTGKQAQLTAADTITISQQFRFSKPDALWAKLSQRIDFNYSLLGVSGSGHFIAVYNDYDFTPEFTKKTFTNEVISFEENANQKDSLFWETKRPVALSIEEIDDYVKKDSLQVLRKSKPYLDSIDATKNKFKLRDILSGYTYTNSFENYSFGMGWPISELRFNTVQGWNFNVNAFYQKQLEDDFKRYYRLSTDFNYGVSDERLRGTATLFFKFNSISSPQLTLEAGVKTEQFNSNEPISTLVNSISTLFFKDNYIKLYDKQFGRIAFSDEVVNGIRYQAELSYQRRKALVNTTDYVLIKNKDSYTSNNPLIENAFGLPAFNTHHIVKFNVDARFSFGQTYMSHPDGKFNIRNAKYPLLYLGFENGFAASSSSLNYQHLKGTLRQSIAVGSLGEFNYYTNAGVFFNADTSNFIDYKHFNGNQTHVTLSDYDTSFFNLPYYAFSTNDSYAQAHLSHNFKGFILNKIPGINALNYNIVLSTKALYTKANLPYYEFGIGLDNIGWGKYRFLRVDYVRSYQNGFDTDAILFGVSF